MEEGREENVEYHIEIQKCEDGVESDNGEVMYVLDFGGADIPENLAMSIAQWAADRSLSLDDGTNSFVLQNDAGLDQTTTTTQLMEIESDTNGAGSSVVDVGGEAPQVIHVKMDDGSDYIMDPSSTGAVDDSVVFNIHDDSSNVIHIEKPGGVGLSRNVGVDLKKVQTSNAGSLLNYGHSADIQIQNADGTRTTIVSRKPFVVKNDNKIERKNARSQVGQSLVKNSSNGGGGNSNNKVTDRLPIAPFLKGKTPVMLMIGDDGQVTTDVSSLPPIKIEDSNKCELEKKSSSAVEILDNNDNANNSESVVDIQKDGSEPMILDFPTEKSRLDNSLRVVANLEKKNVSTTALAVTSASPSKVTTVSLLKSKEDNATESEIEKRDLPENLNAVSEEDKSEKTDEEGFVIKIKEESLEIDEEQTEEKDDLEEGGVDVSDEVKLVLKSELKFSKCCMYEGCDFQDTDPDVFAAHLEDTHQDPLPNCCFECDRRFRLNLTLKIHQLIHRKDARPAKKKRGPYGARDKFYICPLCSEKHKKKRDALIHAQEEHNIEKPYTCESCKFICYSQMELDEHNEVVVHRTDNKNYCDICNQLFTNIYQHKAAVHTTERPHLCNQCGYKAKTKSSLRYHLVTHLTIKDWKCSVCPYKTTTERRLKRHMKIHDPNKTHVCNLCSFATHDSYEYKRHFIKVHSKSKSYCCKFCDQKFDKHHEIRLHLMFEHDSNDAFFCNFCDFTCATRSDYKEHIQTHYGKNKHVCEICGFTGRYKTHYRRHMLTHSDDKPFECKICGKKVSEASNLRRHMLIHSEDKPLACSVCGYRCKIRSRLMNHMKTHSELRPFACHLCKYTTKFNGNLMKHLENHAKYKPHKCQYCSYCCNERNKLKRHMLFRHKTFVESKQEPIDEMNESETNISNSGGNSISNSKEMIRLPSKDQILLVPKEELVIMQGDNQERIVLPVDENGLVMASADQQDLVAQLESGNIILTVEDAPASESHEGHEQQETYAVVTTTASGNETESVVILTTAGGEHHDLVSDGKV